MKFVKSLSLPVLSLALLFPIANASAFDFKSALQKFGFGDKSLAKSAITSITNHPYIAASVAGIALAGAGYFLAKKFLKADKSFASKKTL